MANIIGIGLATLFRLYCYRRWVFLYAEGEAPAAERLEPETSGHLRFRGYRLSLTHSVR